MNALVPKNLRKNEIEGQSLQHPAPVPFVPPSSELLPARDKDKRAIKVRINDETEERSFLEYPFKNILPNHPKRVLYPRRVSPFICVEFLSHGFYSTFDKPNTVFVGASDIGRVSI